MAKDQRFEIVYSQGTITVTEIWVDKETGVNYLYHASGYENAVHTELVIEDSGSGIDADDIQHIFERFYKGKNNKSDSYGIGLALARSIIAGQNGTVKAENVKNTDGKVCGARFIIRFYKGII